MTPVMKDYVTRSNPLHVVLGLGDGENHKTHDSIRSTAALFDGLLYHTMGSDKIVGCATTVQQWRGIVRHAHKTCCLCCGALTVDCFDIQHVTPVKNVLFSGLAGILFVYDRVCPTRFLLRNRPRSMFSSKNCMISLKFEAVIYQYILYILLSAVFSTKQTVFLFLCKTLINTWYSLKVEKPPTSSVLSNAV